MKKLFVEIKDILFIPFALYQYYFVFDDKIKKRAESLLKSPDWGNTLGAKLVRTVVCK